MRTENTLTVIVKSRKKSLFDGQAVSVSSFNDTGPFDVLPYHANFITLINKHITIIKTEGKENIDIERGVLKVTEDQVEAYVEPVVKKQSSK